MKALEIRDAVTVVSSRAEKSHKVALLFYRVAVAAMLIVALCLAAELLAKHVPREVLIALGTILILLGAGLFLENLKRRH